MWTSCTDTDGLLYHHWRIQGVGAVRPWPHPVCQWDLIAPQPTKDFAWADGHWAIIYSTHWLAPCGLRGCKNWPAPFPGRMSYKATKPGLVLFYILACFFIMLMFIRAPFYVLLVFIVCVVCRLVVLVKLSLLAKLLARKTPLSSESSPLQFLALA